MEFNILQLANKYEQYVIDCRRWLHQHPETAWEEWGTTAFIEKELQGMGIETHRFDDEHPGLWAMIEGGKAGVGAKTIMLRSEIDALPVFEQNPDIDYASLTPGKMHACGHDSHMAMLLGAVKILMEIRDELPGNIKLFFQSAEETMIGAKWYVDQGVMDGVDAVYGSHTVSWLDAPYISVEAGPRFAATDEFSIVINGVGCHGGMPYLGRDPIVAAAAVVMNLQHIVSRRTDSLDSLVISIGKIQGGSTYNVITDRVELNGTVRTYSREVRAKVPKMMEEVAKNTAQAFGCTAELEYVSKAPAVNHDHPEMNRIAANAVLKLFGPEVLGVCRPVGGGDDFSYLMEKVPGIYAMIGARNEAIDCAYGHHHPKFNIDESSFIRGTAMFAQFTVDYLFDDKI